MFTCSMQYVHCTLLQVFIGRLFYFQFYSDFLHCSVLFLQGFILIAIVGTCLCLAVFQPMPNGDSSAINEFLVSIFLS